VWAEREEFAFVTRGETEPDGAALATATDRVLSLSGPGWDEAGPCPAVVDRPRPARTMKDTKSLSGDVLPSPRLRAEGPGVRGLRIGTTPPRSAGEPMPLSTASRPMPSAAPKSCSAKPPRRRFSLRWLLVGLLLLIAGVSGFMGLQTSPEVKQPLHAASSSLPPGAVEIDGVRYRPIETYDVCDRVLGENPLVTDEDRANFGPEPDPATWKLLRLLAPKVDGGTAKVTMVQPPEWLAEHRPEVGKTVPIWVPECGIEGMGEVLSIGPCPPLKPGKGAVVLATFEHEVSSTVDLYVTGVDEPIGCTGNHPFWSEDRQEFVRADELRGGEHRSALGRNASVQRIDVDVSPKLVYNIEVQGEHVYRVSGAGVLVHNALPSSQYGVHWTTLQHAEEIFERGVIEASDDLVWVERATSARQLKDILLRGGAGTGARGNAVAIIVDLEGLVPRHVGGGGISIRLPDGLRLTGRAGRGVTWWYNSANKREITRIIAYIACGRRTF